MLLWYNLHFNHNVSDFHVSFLNEMTLITIVIIVWIHKCHIQVQAPGPFQIKPMRRLVVLGNKLYIKPRDLMFVRYSGDSTWTTTIGYLNDSNLSFFLVLFGREMLISLAQPRLTAVVCTQSITTHHGDNHRLILTVSHHGKLPPGNRLVKSSAASLHTNDWCNELSWIC